MSIIDPTFAIIGNSSTQSQNLKILSNSDGTFTIGRADGSQTLGLISAGGTFSPLQATTAGAPAYVKGAMYFDTTLNKLRIGGATAWETVTSV